MKVRRISKEEVEFVLNEPEIIRPGYNSDYLVLTSHPKGRYIKVTISRKRPNLIITAAD
ncbi:MAG: DUF4258 domain-containing protein [Dehalococcoidales bacterium]|nr:DUF4258 domain-containing protein [Dehalococcoidales bacterium]